MTRTVPLDKSGGFLLVEVLIALAIVGLVFGFGYRALSGSFDRLGKDRNSILAVTLAQSILDRVGHDIVLGSGETTGDAGNGFSWLVETAPYTGDPIAASGPLMGYVVRVTVQWKERSNPRQVQLTTLRLAQRERAS